jgi:cation:H+ antiporter
VLTALQLIGALLLLVAASDAFTNAVEWVGALYGLTRSAVGAVVAAIGSSLPETMIAVIALLVLRDASSQAVGIGAVIGAPFMLATVVFAVIGAIALTRKARSGAPRGNLDVHADVAIFGLALFTLTFALAIGASFAPTAFVRMAASVLVVIAYVAYLIYHFKRAGPESDDSPPPLRFRPGMERPHAFFVFAQLAVSLVVTVCASRWFVGSVSAASAQLGLAPLVVSLFLSPIATELPEAMNVAIWMRRGQDELAVGNVLGAMMFQTSIASAIAMLASPWRLGLEAYAAAAAAFAGVLVVIAWTIGRRRVEALPLAACGFLYVAYFVFATVQSHFR